MSMCDILLLYLLGGGIFCLIFFPIRNSRRNRICSALEPFILASDHGDEGALQQLYRERERLNLSDDAYCQYRRNFYTKLAQKNDAFAEYQLGKDALLFLKQPKAAYDHLYRAASLGSAEAMTYLGLLYTSGSAGFPQDDSTAFQWYMNAAKVGYGKAMAEVSDCYRVGFGVQKNKEAALYWAHKGAQQGNAACVYALAECYEMPPTVENRTMQSKYLEDAIRMGDRDIYVKAAKALGFHFGMAFLYNSPLDQFSDRRKAAYCYTLAYFTDTDETLEDWQDRLQKIGYPISQNESRQWSADAKALRYNP